MFRYLWRVELELVKLEVVNVKELSGKINVSEESKGVKRGAHRDVGKCGEERINTKER